MRYLVIAALSAVFCLAPCNDWPQVIDGSPGIAAGAAMPSVVEVHGAKVGTFSTHDVFGTGVVTSAGGQVLTCAHVVAKMEAPKVMMRDGRELDATVTKMDLTCDMAVLALPPGKYEPVRWGDRPHVGDLAVAIGCPDGCPYTVSSGIVSFLNRRLNDKWPDMTQFTAPINPGNSGGPLLNGRGEMIGLVAAVRADAQGLGFAISAARCRSYLKESP